MVNLEQYTEYDALGLADLVRRREGAKSGKAPSVGSKFTEGSHTCGLDAKLAGEQNLSVYSSTCHQLSEGAQGPDPVRTIPKSTLFNNIFVQQIMLVPNHQAAQRAEHDRRIDRHRRKEDQRRHQHHE